MIVIQPGEKRTTHPVSNVGDPTWEVAYLFPPQGRWTEGAYLSLHGNRMVELVDGRLEVLPMPTYFHQKLVEYLHFHLKMFVWPRKLGDATFAPIPVHIRDNHYREPDVVFNRPEQLGQKYPECAELVMEVVSEYVESRERDYVERRVVYAAAGIPEYWIIDPQEQLVIVLTLVDKQYLVHGEFKPGTQATSVLLPEFSIDMTELFAAGKQN
jgi:Uma2 family endonuclease